MPRPFCAKVPIMKIIENLIVIYLPFLFLAGLTVSDHPCFPETVSNLIPVAFSP